MKAVVVGAGIGGLAAALAFLRRGWEAEVLERAPRLEEVGAGIQISPNGFRVLAALGVGEAVEATAYEPQALEMRVGATGSRLFRLPQGEAMRRRFGAPYLQVHRADLLEALRAAVAAAGGVIRTGVMVDGCDGPAALSDGSVAARGDILIGADGLRSAIREAMLGAEAPRFTGAVAWRAVVPREAAPGLPEGACVWVGDGRHAVTYPLRGGRLANFVGVVERDEPGEESWTAEGRRADALADFGDWPAPLPDILKAAEAVHRWPLYDRPPLPRWTDGPVALLGDAAHPMLPSFAQGACQALEDAWRLAAEADMRGKDLPAALKTYEAKRKPRASAIQKGAMENMMRFHRRDGLTRTFGFLPIAAAGLIAPGVIERRSAWVYAHDETGAG